MRWGCIAQIGYQWETKLFYNNFHWLKKKLFFFKEELPHSYDAWISIAKNIPGLIKNGELRAEVEKV